MDGARHMIICLASAPQRLPNWQLRLACFTVALKPPVISVNGNIAGTMRNYSGGTCESGRSEY